MKDKEHCEKSIPKTETVVPNQVAQRAYSNAIESCVKVSNISKLPP